MDLLQQSILRAKIAPRVASIPQTSTVQQKSVDVPRLVQIPIVSGENEALVRIERKLDGIINKLNAPNHNGESEPNGPTKYLSGKAIKEIVCAFFRISERDIDRASHFAPLARARQIGFYLCREQTLKSFPEIARLFKRDHSTILHGYRKIELQRKTDTELDLDLVNLEAQITAALAKRNEIAGQS